MFHIEHCTPGRYYHIEVLWGLTQLELDTAFAELSVETKCERRHMIDDFKGLLRMLQIEHCTSLYRLIDDDGIIIH